MGVISLEILLLRLEDLEEAERLRFRDDPDEKDSRRLGPTNTVAAEVGIGMRTGGGRIQPVCVSMIPELTLI